MMTNTNKQILLTSFAIKNAKACTITARQSRYIKKEKNVSETKLKMFAVQNLIGQISQMATVNTS